MSTLLSALRKIFPVDPDASMSANSDTLVASQRATKSAIAAAISGLETLVGDINCSTNPNYPAATKGQGWRVSAAGKIGGASGRTVSVDDIIIAMADNAGGTQASVGASWTISQGNLVEGEDYLNPTHIADALSALSSVYQPLEDQRLSTTGAVTFASVAGDGSGMSNVTAVAGWPTDLSSYINDTGFMVNAGTGVGSLALGFSATATGDYSLALGNNSTSAGIAAVAVGSATASGSQALAMGLNATASGDHSEVFGRDITNSTDYSLEIGYTDSYKLQISSAGFNFIGAGITLNSATPWQTPLTAGTDYVTPTGDGSGLTGVVAASGWPTILSGYSNDVGFLTSAEMNAQSVGYANSAGSAGESPIVSGTFGDSLQNTSGSQWTMSGDLQVGNGGIGCEFLSPVYFGLRSNPYRVDTSGNAYLYTLDIATGLVTIDTGGNYNSTYGSVTASHFYGDGGGLTGITASQVGADPAGSAAAITLSGLGGVPTSRTVAGHALTGNVTITASDVGADAAGAAAAVTPTTLGLVIGTNVDAFGAAAAAQAYAVQRANHTGTQAASTITGLAAVATSGSAADLGSGTLPDARLSSNVVSLSGTQTLTNKTLTAPAMPGAIYYAAANQTSIVACATAAAADGGGTVKIPAGTITLTAPIILQTGVIFEGSGTSWECSTNAHNASVGTILVGDGTFNCFQYNNIDNANLLTAGNPSPVASCVKGAGIRSMSITGFLYGIKIGAANQSGMAPILLEDLSIDSCTQWGIWLENSTSGGYRNINVSHNTVGQLWHGSSTPAWSFGNTYGTNIFAVSGPTSRGICFNSRNAGGSIGMHVVTGLNVIGNWGGNPRSVYTAACTITSSSADIAVANLSKFVYGSAITLSATTGGITAGVNYFVLSQSGTSGSGTIRISAQLGGTAIVPSGSGTPNISTKGPALLEMAGEGDSMANNCFGVSVYGVDLEVPGYAGMLLQNGIACDVHLSVSSVPIVVRTSYAENSIRMATACPIDLDANSRHIQLYGLPVSSSVGGNTGVGIRNNNSIGYLHINGNGASAFQQTTNNWVSPGPFASLSFPIAGPGDTNQAGGFTTAGNAINFNYAASAPGTVLLATINTNNVGCPVFITNSTAYLLTMSTQSSQLVNNEAGVTTFLVPPKSMRVAFAMPGPSSSYYWAVTPAKSLTKTTAATTGATPLVVADTTVRADSIINFTVHTVGGTISQQPVVVSKTAGVGFSIIVGAADTSTYDYVIENLP